MNTTQNPKSTTNANKGNEVPGRRFCFELTKPSRQGLEFPCGLFAADSKRELDSWVTRLRKLQAGGEWRILGAAFGVLLV